MQKIATLVSSKKFFYGVVALLVIQALWIALSGRYPMAFDEDFHLGIIRLYARHISPFWVTQPTHSDMFGAVYRDPSYLYHYLMSFPYRLISLFVHGQTGQVMALRLVNIAMFATSLPLLRRLLLHTGASRTLAHIVLAFFVLLPITPFLAAQINYDNLFVPLVALVLLLAVRFNNELARYGRLNIKLFAVLAVTCLLASLVKYAFLPVFIALVLYEAVLFYYYLGRKRKFWKTVWFGLTLISRRMRWLLIGLLLVSSVLFVERYGVNLARYHEPVPDCVQVLSIQRCSSYAPWLRDYIFASQKGQNLHGPLGFTNDWLYGMWFRTFFAVDGPGTNFETRGPLLLPGLSAIVLFAGGLLALIVKFREVSRRYNRLEIYLLIVVTGWYVALLWFDEYKSYLHAGMPVAINGRYLLPVLVPLMVLLAMGYSEVLRRHDSIKAVIVCAGLLCFLWGGGVLTFILRSRDAWYWPNTPMTSMNESLQRGLYHVVPGANNPIQFLR
ncbi:MAG TPA: DUF2142 domain-containing protein [Candidatus Saccharimonadales bacterium]|nr:DUF2142 domain-containing protein [Candidatus Saccharimonadales bacterium]